MGYHQVWQGQSHLKRGEIFIITKHRTKESDECEQSCFKGLDLAAVLDEKIREIVKRLLNRIEELSDGLRKYQRGELHLRRTPAQASNLLIKNQENFRSKKEAVYHTGLRGRKRCSWKASLRLWSALIADTIS